MFRNLISSEIGLIHLIFSILSIIFGSFILFTEKGTNLHRKTGYFYAVCMLTVNVTALMIFRLTGKFGVFHALAIWGLLSVVIGIAAAMIRRPAKNWLVLHYYFMYWSVIGLYAAFAAELAVRLPKVPFWGTVGIASGLVSVAGTLAYFKIKGRWDKLAAVYK